MPERLPSAAAATARAPIDERMGAAIRRARLARGLTLGDVAQATCISVPMLSRFETGQSAVTIVLLERICARLGTDLSTFFSEVEQRTGEARLIKASDQMEVVRSGTKYGHSYRLLSCQRGARKVFEPFLIDIDKQGESYARFRHPGTEFIYMLRGRMQYRLEDRTFLIEPGDAYTFCANVLHGPEKLLDDHIQFITVMIYAE
ncbi:MULTISPECIES: helix-turn-helix domain-containing protein [unclassified Bradyrhizobium]